MNEVAILIRFCYGDGYNEAERAWRFQWFKEQTLPRLLAQTVEFDLWLWVNPRHREEVEAMSQRIRTFTVDSPAVALEARHLWTSVRGLPKYPVQIRVDSDDFLAPTFVARSLEVLATMPGRRALVWFQPYKVDVKTGAVYWCSPMRRGERLAYADDKPSAFVAMRQPTNRSRYDWVYGRGHTKLHLLVTEVKAGGEGLCVASCHSFNDSTVVYESDRLVERPGWL